MTSTGEQSAVFITAPFMTIAAAPGSVFMRLSAHPDGANSALCEMTPQEALQMRFYLDQAIRQAFSTGSQGANHDSRKSVKVLNSNSATNRPLTEQ